MTLTLEMMNQLSQVDKQQVLAVDRQVDLIMVSLTLDSSLMAKLLSSNIRMVDSMSHRKMQLPRLFDIFALPSVPGSRQQTALLGSIICGSTRVGP